MVEDMLSASVNSATSSRSKLLREPETQREFHNTVPDRPILYIFLIIIVFKKTSKMGS